jgi:hypothetical protein
MSLTTQHHCCAHVTSEPVEVNAPAPSAASFKVGARVWGIVKTATPGAILVLLPKCPLCIVGYAAAAGIGLSISTAANLRSLTVFVCLGLLVFFAARQISLLRRYLPGRSS